MTYKTGSNVTDRVYFGIGKRGRVTRDRGRETGRGRVKGGHTRNSEFRRGIERTVWSEGGG